MPVDTRRGGCYLAANRADFLGFHPVFNLNQPVIVEESGQDGFIRNAIVAAVGGFALAGGFDLALCGDIIIASESAIFGHPEIRFGVNPLLTPLWRKVGVSKAMEIAMTGETIGAEEAHRIGLVIKVVPAEKLLDEAFEIARKLAKIEPRALAAVLIRKPA